MPTVLKIVLGVIFFAYPFIIYYGLLNYALWQVALLISILAGVRAFIFKNGQSQMAKIGFYAALLLMAFSLLSVLLNQKGWLKIYPIILSLMFFAVFFRSLFSKKSMIQHFAELKEKDIDAKKQSYMRKLTVVWCVFFIINATISTYTLIFSSMSQWTLYNGLISYILIGSLVGLELVYRHLFVLRK